MLGVEGIDDRGVSGEHGAFEQAARDAAEPAWRQLDRHERREGVSLGGGDGPGIGEAEAVVAASAKWADHEHGTIRKAG